MEGGWLSPGDWQEELWSSPFPPSPLVRSSGWRPTETHHSAAAVRFLYRVAGLGHLRDRMTNSGRGTGSPRRSLKSSACSSTLRRASWGGSGLHQVPPGGEPVGDLGHPGGNRSLERLAPGRTVDLCWDLTLDKVAEEERRLKTQKDWCDEDEMKLHWNSVEGSSSWN